MLDHSIMGLRLTVDISFYDASRTVLDKSGEASIEVAKLISDYQ